MAIEPGTHSSPPVSGDGIQVYEETVAQVQALADQHDLSFADALDMIVSVVNAIGEFIQNGGSIIVQSPDGEQQNLSLENFLHTQDE